MAELVNRALDMARRVAGGNPTAAPAPVATPTSTAAPAPELPKVTLPEKGVSTRCFVEYEIDLSGTEIKLHTHALFKRVLKIGTKFFVVAELIGNHVQEYSVEIVTVRAMHYIPLTAKYVDSMALAGDDVAHFFVQPKGASTDTAPVKELLGHQVRRPESPQREEDVIARGNRRGKK